MKTFMRFVLLVGYVPVMIWVTILGLWSGMVEAWMQIRIEHSEFLRLWRDPLEKVKTS